MLHKSHNKVHGLTLCAIIAFNMILKLLPHLCTPHIQLSVRSLSRTVNFKHRLNYKDQGGFPMLRKEGQTLNMPLRMMKLLITLWMVYQYTQSLQKYRNSS